jgi:hypothetical protein
MKQAHPTRSRWTLSPRARRLALTAHIVASVGLLGEQAGYFAIAIRGASTDDAALADSAWELLAMFGFIFGIPFSFATLGTGILLGVGSKWGVFRYPWVTTKLALILSVILMGTLVLGPSVEALGNGEPGLEPRVVLGAAWNLLALAAATTLSVYKPGRRRQFGVRQPAW